MKDTKKSVSYLAYNTSKSDYLRQTFSPYWLKIPCMSLETRLTNIWGVITTVDTLSANRELDICKLSIFYKLFCIISKKRTLSQKLNIGSSFKKELRNLNMSISWVE